MAALLLLAACTVGPDFERPRMEMPAGWAGNPAATDPAVTSKPILAPAEIAAWWTVFGDPTLTALVQDAAVANLDLGRAEARIRQARATRTIAAGGLYPAANASASATRSRAGGSGGTRSSSTGNLFRAGFDASWELDVFGGIRRGVEVADAQIDSALNDRNAIMVTLAGEVATAYADLRGSQRQLAIAHENLAAQQQTLDLTRERFEAGFVSALDVANSTAQVASTTARIPSLEAAIRASIYTLAVLLAREPDALVADLSRPAPLPSAPPAVPIGLPSELLERRPDIARAESDLHAATARIGVAAADLYPRFSLTGSFGLQSGSISSFGSIANHFWSFGPAASWPIFQGGAIRGNIELQRAAADEAFLTFKQAVLVALQDAETSLSNFTREQERRAALEQSVAANRQAVDLALQLYSAGRTDFLNVLSSQRLLFEAEDTLAQSRTTVITDLVAVYKALGGGWEPEPQPNEPRPLPNEPRPSYNEPRP